MGDRTKEKNVKPVRIDARTVIYVSKDIDDDVARENYLNKLDASVKSYTERAGDRRSIVISKAQVGPSGAGYSE